MIDPAQPGPRIIINAMPLETYRSKRNFKATPEPEGQATKRKAQQLSFVVQKHAASHLHYDFRLELNGVLLSWAIPKGPSLDPKDKRLAVHVEDHPIEYGSFEGVIPPKQYGSGTVMLWDRGVWLPKDDPSEGYRKGKLKFDLHGQKLMGGWTLVRSHGAKYGDRAWLLIKEDDAFARRGAEALIGEVQPHSAASGRSLDEIAADPERVWHSNKSLADNVANNVTSGAARSSKPRFSFAKVAGAIKRAMPEMIEPQLATLVRDAPSGDQWMHELKYDGYRMLCRIERGQARMISRSGRDWTDRFAPIARAAARLPVSSCWMDGEVVALEPDGRSSFQELQNALAHQSAARLQYVLFDLLVCDGWDLRGAALTERKRLLEQLLSSAPAPLKYSVHVQGSGPEFLEQAARLGLEGVVSKHAEANYQAGRTRQWLKIKCEMRQEMVIGGFTNPEGSRAGFGALLLGVYQADGTLRYSGKVGTGFNDAVLASLHQRLLGLVQKAAPFSNPPKGAEARRAHWVAPQLVAEIAFTEWTDEGTLRHAVFLGLREDKQASEVVRERPRGSLTSQAAASRSVRAERGTSAAATIVRASNHRTASSKSSDMIAGVKLTNPDKLLYPDAKLSKRDLALYYETVGERIVAHLRDRPLTLLRHPNGWDKPGFYQKHADETVHEAIERVTVQDSDGPAIYMMANSVSAVVALLQLGALELHPWGRARGQTRISRSHRVRSRPGRWSSLERARSGGATG